MKNPTLSAVLIVKDEEDIIEKALLSVKDFDEIVVVDTGSTDSTIEIAKKYTDKIYHFEWVKDFSAARNYGIEKSTCDWIYSIDADHELLSTVELVRDEAQKAEILGHKTAFVQSLSGKDDVHKHWREVLYKNDPEVRWTGAVHEVLHPVTTHRSLVVRRCGYSKNHYKEPDRNLDILLNSPMTPRTKFYLGREYFEKKKYDESIRWMNEYLQEGKWIPEISEAWLVKARSHWFMNQGEMARESCLQAIKSNPDFKEALIFMGNIHYEPWTSKWHNLASVAKNQDVLFIRTH